MRLNRLIAMVVALMLIGSAAMAMPVRYREGTLTLSCSKDGSPVTIDVDQFHLLGVGTDGNYLIYTDEGYFTLLEVPQTLSQEDINRISVMSYIKEADYSTLKNGQSNEAVRQLQSQLTILGFYHNSIDGSFGRITENAIKDFQKSMGMVETGEAEPRLQMLMRSLTQPTVELTSVKVEDNTPSKLDIIGQKAGIDVQPIVESGLTLRFDEFTGEGFVSDGGTITYNSSGASDIDQYTITLQFGLLVREMDDGTATINPAMKASCTCVRRPVFESVTLKSGDYRGSAAFEDLNAALKGVKIEEKGIAILNEQMIDALANAVEADELKIRVSGRYQTFDINTTKSYLDAVARVGLLAKQLLQG